MSGTFVVKQDAQFVVKVMLLKLSPKFNVGRLRRKTPLRDLEERSRLKNS